MSIQVTLTFATAAEAANALAALSRGQVAPVSEPAKEAPAPKKPTAEKAVKEESKPAAPAVDTSAVEPKDDAPEAEAVLDYKVLQTAVFALAGKSRDAAIAMNKQFGVANMRDLPEGKRREALAAVNEKIAELEVA